MCAPNPLLTTRTRMAAQPPSARLLMGGVAWNALSRAQRFCKSSTARRGADGERCHAVVAGTAARYGSGVCRGQHASCEWWWFVRGRRGALDPGRDSGARVYRRRSSCGCGAVFSARGKPVAWRTQLRVTPPMAMPHDCCRGHAPRHPHPALVARVGVRRCGCALPGALCGFR